MTDYESSFDGVSGCKTCDRANVANIIHGTRQLIACEINDIDDKDDALELIENLVDEYGQIRN